MKKVLGIMTPRMPMGPIQKSGSSNIANTGKVGSSIGYNKVSCAAGYKGKQMKSGKGTGAM